MSELSLTPGGGEQPATQNLQPVSTSPNTSFSETGILQRIRDAFAQPAVVKSIPMIGFLGVVALAAMAWLALREPPQRDLFRGLPDDDKAAVATALQTSSIMYQIDNATGALTVSEDDYHAAKLSLAAQGLPRSAPDGDSMISNMPMGASRAVETEKLRTARELDLARTIESFDSIQSARVHLAVEPPSIFVRDRSEPAASIMLQLRGNSRLGESQVQAIVHLVASSVPGLSAEKVSVADQNGRLLSRPGQSGAEGSGEQLGVQERVEERYRRTLTALLTPMLGQGNFAAEVMAEMDFDEKQATRESYPTDGARLRSENGSWANEPGQKQLYGIPGAIAPRAPAEAEVTETPPASVTGVEPEATAGEVQTAKELTKTSEKYARNFELGREVSVTKEASGTVKRISVAVALRNPTKGKSYSAEELAAIESLVKGAIGFDQARGDQVAISSRDFPVAEVAAEEAWYESSWVALLVRNISALFVALALIFGIGRPLLKKRAQLAEKAEEHRAQQNSQLLTEISGALDRELESKPGEPVTIDMIMAAQNYQSRATLVQNFVRQNPEHATLVVRDLLKESGQTKEEADA
ncbi:flagellar basal-body MS-ring/collar protein FliF [Parasphingorhabdus sp.]|uniref:flagellar basal-body MS-ring/collar protein FliF n=2 Tax=Parasphingorhabdus sp. TaxID=2709688 RepID=UPI00326746C3